MHPFTLLSLALSTFTFAQQQDSCDCLDQASATRVADNFAYLISAFSPTNATRALAPDFTDYSDSTVSVINGGCPIGPKTLGSPTFTSEQQYASLQATQPDIPFEILNVKWGCDFVTFRWRSSNPAQGQASQPATILPVVGINFAEVVRGSGEEPWLIKTMYGESNSAAWLYDLQKITPVGCPSSSKFRY